jgi:MoaA/NifB/PqqE/SkfB family radical SAM enzyme
MTTNFWTTPELKQIHIELTNACNAACPMCVRFYRNSPLPRPDLEVGQITLDKFKQYFPPEILQPCAKIMFCGVHGDPCMARDMLEICEYIQENTTMKFAIQVHTNGGMRNPEWWAELGKVFAKRNQMTWECWRVIFSVDGLEDTNHIYRRNVKWNNLIANIKAFTGAGGNAGWEYLIFKHNEHQLEEAEALSKELGFKLFIPKKALGVAHDNMLQPMSALSKEGKLEYVIEAPTIAKYRNVENPEGISAPPKLEFKIEDYRKLKETKSNENYKARVDSVYDIIAKQDLKKLDSCEIKCKASKDWGAKEIFVDNFGRVIPCCYIGTHLNGADTNINTLQLHKAMDDYGWDNFDLNKHSLKEILDAGHLDRVFADTWSKGSIKEGKMGYCASICGEESRVDRVYFQKYGP